MESSIGFREFLRSRETLSHAGLQPGISLDGNQRLHVDIVLLAVRTLVAGGGEQRSLVGQVPMVMEDCVPGFEAEPGEAGQTMLALRDVVQTGDGGVIRDCALVLSELYLVLAAQPPSALLLTVPHRFCFVYELLPLYHTELSHVLTAAVRDHATALGHVVQGKVCKVLGIIADTEKAALPFVIELNLAGSERVGVEVRLRLLYESSLFLCIEPSGTASSDAPAKDGPIPTAVAAALVKMIDWLTLAECASSCKVASAWLDVAARCALRGVFFLWEEEAMHCLVDRLLEVLPATPSPDALLAILELCGVVLVKLEPLERRRLLQDVMPRVAEAAVALAPREPVAFVCGLCELLGSLLLRGGLSLGGALQAVEESFRRLNVTLWHTAENCDTDRRESGSWRGEGTPDTGGLLILLQPNTTCYWLLATGYWLLATCYLLLATCYLLLATCYLLLATCYLLLATCYLLLAACYLLLTTHYSLLTTLYALLTTHYSLLTTHYSLLTTYYLLKVRCSA